MRAYFRLIKQKSYIGFCIVLSCAFLGALRGAWKESGTGYIGVTQNDLVIMQQNDDNAPDLIGIIGLAAEQERWYNFNYALIYGGRGIIIYCLLMAAYLPLYGLRFFKVIRAFLGRDGTEERLFINTDFENQIFDIENKNFGKGL